MSALPAAPVGSQELAGLFAGLDRPLALAVSGGVDSMALMHLVAQWRGEGGGKHLPAPLLLTIDHGLRPAAADEARFVADAARQLGFDHETLLWTGTKPTSGIQDAARRARYALLLERLAADATPRDLLLAHHQDDQAETLIMRLARGSGIDGLSAMRPVERRVVVQLAAPVREVVVRLRRPLLDLPKARLMAILTAIGASWRDDPTNADIRYERVRLRRSQTLLRDLGLTHESLARSARRLGAERQSVLARTRALAVAHVQDHGGAYGEFVLPPGHDRRSADVVRILARLIDVFGGEAPPAQLSQIEALAERVLSSSEAAPGRLTLGGCLIDIIGTDPARRVVTAFRETSRAALPTVVLQPGDGCFWDRRFYVGLAATAPAPVVLMPWPAGVAAPMAGPRGHVAALPAIGPDAAPTLLFARRDLPVTCDWPMQHVAGLKWLDQDDGTTETI